MKKWICTVCGYVHEGDAAPAEFLRYESKDRRNRGIKAARATGKTPARLKSLAAYG